MLQMAIMLHTVTNFQIYNIYIVGGYDHLVICSTVWESMHNICMYVSIYACVLRIIYK